MSKSCVLFRNVRLSSVTRYEYNRCRQLSQYLPNIILRTQLIARYTTHVNTISFCFFGLLSSVCIVHVGTIFSASVVDVAHTQQQFFSLRRASLTWYSVIYFAVTFLRHIQHDEANTKTGILWYSHDEPSNKLTGEECAKKSSRLVPSGPSTSLVLNAGTWALKMHRFTYSWSKIIVFKAPRRCNEIADVCCINIIYDTKMKHIISSTLKINSGFPFRTRQAFLSCMIKDFNDTAILCYVACFIVDVLLLKAMCSFWLLYAKSAVPFNTLARSSVWLLIRFEDNLHILICRFTSCWSNLPGMLRHDHWAHVQSIWNFPSGNIYDKVGKRFVTCFRWL